MALMGSSLQGFIMLVLFATVFAAPITLHKISDGECLEMGIDQKDAIDQITMFAGVTVGSCSSKGFFEQHGTKTLALPFVGEVICKRMSKPIATPSTLKADAFLPLMPFSGRTAMKAAKVDMPNDYFDSWDQEKLSKDGVFIPDSPSGTFPASEQNAVFSTAVKRPEIPVTQDLFRVGMYKLKGDDCLQMRVPLLFKPAAMDIGGFKEGSCGSLGFTESGSTKRQRIAGVPAPVNVQTFTRTSTDMSSTGSATLDSAPTPPQRAQLPWDNIPDPLNLDKFRVSLYKIDGDECQETRVDAVFKPAATAVGRWAEGTCSSLGYTAFGDTTSARIPTAPVPVPVAVFTNPVLTPDPSKASSKRKSSTRGKGRENLEKLVDKYRITMYKISATGQECSEARVDFAFFPAVSGAGMWHKGSCMSQGFTIQGEAKRTRILGVPFSVSARAFKKEKKEEKAPVQQLSTTAKPSFQLYGPAAEPQENSKDPAYLWKREETAREHLLDRPLPASQPNVQVQTPVSTFDGPSTIADVFEKPGTAPSFEARSKPEAAQVPGENTQGFNSQTADQEHPLLHILPGRSREEERPFQIGTPHSLEPQVGSSLGNAVRVPDGAVDTEVDRETATRSTRNRPTRRPSIIDEFHTDPNFELYGSPGSVVNGRPKTAARRWWRQGGKYSVPPQHNGKVRTASSSSELYGPGAAQERDPFLVRIKQDQPRTDSQRAKSTEERSAKLGVEPTTDMKIEATTIAPGRAVEIEATKDTWTRSQARSQAQDLPKIHPSNPASKLHTTIHETKIYQSSEDPSNKDTAHADPLGGSSPSQPNVQLPTTEDRSQYRSRVFQDTREYKTPADMKVEATTIASTPGRAVEVEATKDTWTRSQAHHDTEVEDNKATWWTQRLRDPETASTGNGPSSFDEPPTDLYGAPGDAGSMWSKKDQPQKRTRWWTSWLPGVSRERDERRLHESTQPQRSPADFATDVIV